MLSKAILLQALKRNLVSVLTEQEMEMLANQVVVDYFNALGHSTPEISQFYMGVEVLGARIESGRELKVRMSKATSGRILAEMDGFDGDRKSTRLNSSHTVISYAVFCLKKKKKKKKKKNRHRDTKHKTTQ